MKIAEEVKKILGNKGLPAKINRIVIKIFVSTSIQPNRNFWSRKENNRNSEQKK